MDDSVAVTWASEADRKRDMRRQKIATFKWNLAMWWHGAYWWVLHRTYLARPYSVTLCRLRLYRKFVDGRCMWCGERHAVGKIREEG